MASGKVLLVVFVSSVSILFGAIVDSCEEYETKPHEDDSKMFFMCDHGGEFRPFMCPDGMVFNRFLQTCVDPSNENQKSEGLMPDYEAGGDHMVGNPEEEMVDEASKTPDDSEADATPYTGNDGHYMKKRQAYDSGTHDKEEFYDSSSEFHNPFTRFEVNNASLPDGTEEHNSTQNYMAILQRLHDFLYTLSELSYNNSNFFGENKTDEKHDYTWHQTALSEDGQSENQKVSIVQVDSVDEITQKALNSSTIMDHLKTTLVLETPEDSKVSTVETPDTEKDGHFMKKRQMYDSKTHDSSSGILKMNPPLPDGTEEHNSTQNYMAILQSLQDLIYTLSELSYNNSDFYGENKTDEKHDYAWHQTALSEDGRSQNQKVSIVQVDSVDEITQKALNSSTIMDILKETLVLETPEDSKVSTLETPDTEKDGHFMKKRQMYDSKTHGSSSEIRDSFTMYEVNNSSLPDGTKEHNPTQNYMAILQSLQDLIYTLSELSYNNSDFYGENKTYENHDYAGHQTALSEDGHSENQKVSIVQVHPVDEITQGDLNSSTIMDRQKETAVLETPEDSKVSTLETPDTEKYGHFMKKRQMYDSKTHNEEGFHDSSSGIRDSYTTFEVNNSSLPDGTKEHNSTQNYMAILRQIFYDFLSTMSESSHNNAASHGENNKEEEYNHTWYQTTETANPSEERPFHVLPNEKGSTAHEDGNSSNQTNKKEESTTNKYVLHSYK